MFERIRNKNILSPALFVALSLLLTAVGIALRLINTFFFFDYDIGYYQSGAILPIIMNAFLVLSTLFFGVASLFLTRVPDSYSGCERNPFTILASSLCAITFIASGVNFWLFRIMLPAYVQILIPTLSIFAILSFCSSFYFISNVASFIGKYRAPLAIIVILNAVCILAISYFDITIQMNSPQKLLLHISCLASIFFFATEARCIFESIRKRIYIFLLCTGMFFSGIYSIPSLVSFLLEKPADPNFISFSIIFFAVFIYIVIRAVTLMISDKAPKAADSVSEEAPQSQEEENI